MEKKSALAVVAHPDDETIWMGGTIIKNPQWQWTIFSLCRQEDLDRAPKFKRVCEHYNANPIISNLDDENLKPIPTEEIINKIKENLPSTNYNYIFTHGENGEYGHIRHIEVHKAIKSMIENRNLNCDSLYFFSYLPSEINSLHDPETKIPIPNESADLITNLSNKEHEEKIRIGFRFSSSRFEIIGFAL